MLSPPILTGVIPANTLIKSTSLISIKDRSVSVWDVHAELRSTPSTLILILSSFSPCIYGIEDTDPFAALSIPVKYSKSDEVSCLNC